MSLKRIRTFQDVIRVSSRYRISIRKDPLLLSSVPKIVGATIKNWSSIIFSFLDWTTFRLKVSAPKFEFRNIRKRVFVFDKQDISSDNYIIFCWSFLGSWSKFIMQSYSTERLSTSSDQRCSNDLGVEILCNKHLQSGKCILLTENELKCMYKRDSICAVDKFSIIKINWLKE